MFEYIVALLSYLPDESPKFYHVATYNFNLGLQIGDSVLIQIIFEGDIYRIRSNVKRRDNVVLPRKFHSRDGEDTSIFQIAIFCEAEDKQLVQKLGERFAAKWKSEFNVVDSSLPYHGDISALGITPI